MAPARQMCTEDPLVNRNPVRGFFDSREALVLAQSPAEIQRLGALGLGQVLVEPLKVTFGFLLEQNRLDAHLSSAHNRSIRTRRNIEPCKTLTQAD